jgi:hypothetical protein
VVHFPEDEPADKEAAEHEEGLNRHAPEQEDAEAVRDFPEIVGEHHQNGHQATHAVERDDAPISSFGLRLRLPKGITNGVHAATLNRIA